MGDSLSFHRLNSVESGIEDSISDTLMLAANFDLNFSGECEFDRFLTYRLWYSFLVAWMRVKFCGCKGLVGTVISWVVPMCSDERTFIMVTLGGLLLGDGCFWRCASIS